MNQGELFLGSTRLVSMRSQMRVHIAPQRLGLFALVIVPMQLMSCADVPTSTSDTTIRDSSGVNIISFDEMIMESLPVWTLSDEPEISLEGVEGDTGFEFFRVVDAYSLADGGIAVADGGANEIRIFDQVGNPVRTVGAQGQGPGEFRALSWIAPGPDEGVIAGDLGIGRVTQFDLVGNPVQTSSTLDFIEELGVSSNIAPQPLGVFSDGSIIVASFAPIEPNTGSLRSVVTGYRLLPESRQVVGFTEWLGPELFGVMEDGRTGVSNRLFQREPIVLVRDSILLVGDTDLWDIRQYSQEGEPVLSLRYSHLPISVTPELIELALETRYQGVPAGPDREGLISRWRNVDHHVTLPAFSAIEGDTDHLIWVASYPVPGEDGITWLAIDPRRGPVGKLELLQAQSVLSFGPMSVIILNKDELDREGVLRYGIVR